MSRRLEVHDLSHTSSQVKGLCGDPLWGWPTKCNADQRIRAASLMQGGWAGMRSILQGHQFDALRQVAYHWVMHSLIVVGKHERATVLCAHRRATAGDRGCRGRTATAHGSAGAGGTLAAVGHAPRGLQRQRGRLELLQPRIGTLTRLSLGRGTRRKEKKA
jgi:hypothetical protein